MILSKKVKTFLLLLGDVGIFYASLYLTLALRYGLSENTIGWEAHQTPFLYVHILWIFVFYISGLYDITIFSSFKKTFERVLKTMATSGIAAMVIFYLVPAFKITPKTNLLIDIFILAFLLVFWRRIFWNLAGRTSKIKTLFFGSSKEVEELAKTLLKNPHFGYEPAVILESVDRDLIQLIKEKNIQLIVASRNVINNKEAAKRFYDMLPLGVSIVDFESFYESLSEKIPVSMVNESWFLENLMEINKKGFENFKRIFDVALALVLSLPTLVLLPFVALLIKMNSRGPVFYKQKRVGKNGLAFEIIKFRSMADNAEKNGAEWAKEKDSRITGVGNFLRKSRLDELPQLCNILRGEMSFVGPRPERPEFVGNLQKEIPHYAMRHLVKPGLSGWAQIKFPYGASVNDAMEKLQFDLYYIKNRSMVLDLAITAKTVATILSRTGR